MVVGLDLEKLKQVKLDDDVHKNSTSMEEKDLEDRRIDDAIKFIKETEQEHRGIISALFKQSGLAGLKGSKRFDALLKKTKGKRVHRGTSEDSRPLPENC